MSREQTLSKIKIEDNFLEQEKFNEIQLMLDPMADPNPTNPSIPWFFKYKYYAESAGAPAKNELDQFQFTHTFYDSGAPQSSQMQQLQCLVDLLKPVAIYRIVGNLLTRLPNIVKNPFHTDLSFLAEEQLKQWTTSIFYVNTNNGYTVFEDGTKVESVANRMLTFPANMKHTGTTCTDQSIRIIINFNYYKNT